MNPEDYETLPSASVGVHMTAGAFAGIMEHCVMYPLDSVKVIKLIIRTYKSTVFLLRLRTKTHYKC